MSNFKPGGVKIHSIKLWSTDKSRSVSNIANLVKNIKIYEAITDPFMTAVFSVVDGVGLSSTFPLIGEEYIEIDFETPGYGDVVSLRFDVIDIKDKIQSSEDKSVMYNLYCASPEFRANNKVLKDIYNNQSPFQIIKKLFKYLETQKNLYVIPASFPNIDLDVTNLLPAQAIDKLRLQSRNPDEKSSAFCFFENKNGFIFTTVEQLMKDGKTKIGDKKYYFDAGSNRSIYTGTLRNIVALSRLSEASPFSGIMKGQLNSQIKTVDIITRTVENKVFRESEDGDFEFADANPSSLRSGPGQVKDGSRPSKTVLNIIDTSKNGPNLQEISLERSAYVSRLIQQIFRIELYGDTALNVGDVIEVNMPSSSALDDSPPLDERFTGNFLVSKICHNISLMGARAVHSMTCEILKGNLSG